MTTVTAAFSLVWRVALTAPVCALAQAREATPSVRKTEVRQVQAVSVAAGLADKYFVVRTFVDLRAFADSERNKAVICAEIPVDDDIDLQRKNKVLHWGSGGLLDFSPGGHLFLDHTSRVEVDGAQHFRNFAIGGETRFSVSDDPADLPSVVGDFNDWVKNVSLWAGPGSQEKDYAPAILAAHRSGSTSAGASKSGRRGVIRFGAGRYGTSVPLPHNKLLWYEGAHLVNISMGGTVVFPLDGFPTAEPIVKGVDDGKAGNANFGAGIKNMFFSCRKGGSKTGERIADGIHIWLSQNGILENVTISGVRPGGTCFRLDGDNFYLERLNAQGAAGEPAAYGFYFNSVKAVSGNQLDVHSCDVAYVFAGHRYNRCSAVSIQGLACEWTRLPLRITGGRGIHLSGVQGRRPVKGQNGFVEDSDRGRKLALITPIQPTRPSVNRRDFNDVVLTGAAERGYNHVEVQAAVSIDVDDAADDASRPCLVYDLYFEQYTHDADYRGRLDGSGFPALHQMKGAFAFSQNRVGVKAALEVVRGRDYVDMAPPRGFAVDDKHGGAYVERLAGDQSLHVTDHRAQDGTIRFFLSRVPEQDATHRICQEFRPD